MLTDILVDALPENRLPTPRRGAPASPSPEALHGRSAKPRYHCEGEGLATRECSPRECSI
eukprot:8299753-Pyramimonas_sp.AAC.1